MNCTKTEMTSASTIRQDLALPTPLSSTFHSRPVMNSPQHNNMILSSTRCGVSPHYPNANANATINPNAAMAATPRLPSLRGILEKMSFDQPAPPLKRPRSLDSMEPIATMRPVIPCATVNPARMTPLGGHQPQSLRANFVPSPAMAAASRRPILSTPTSFSLETPSTTTVTPTLPHQKIASRKRSWTCMGAPKAVPFTNTTPVNRSRASKYCKVEGCQRVSQRNNLCHSHGGKRLCRETGCNSKDRGNGFCIKHGGGKICSVACCEKKARRKGLCTQHFRVLDLSEREGTSNSNSISTTSMVPSRF